MPGWLDVGLTLDPGQPLRVGSECLGENLQRDLPVQLGIGGLIDLSHPALADEGGDLVAPYALDSHLIRPETDAFRVQFLRSGRGGNQRSEA